jgi:hypothetical protein
MSSRASSHGQSGKPERRASRVEDIAILLAPQQKTRQPFDRFWCAALWLGSISGMARRFQLINGNMRKRAAREEDSDEPPPAPNALPRRTSPVSIYKLFAVEAKARHDAEATRMANPKGASAFSLSARTRIGRPPFWE